MVYIGVRLKRSEYEKILLFLLAISLILFSCSDDAGQKGNLSIRINEMASRHISPVDMDVSYYEILLTHRDQGLNLEYTLQKPSPQMNVELVTGEWNVKAEAYNKDGMLVGGGSATATILPKKNTSVSIPVNEFSGEGTLEVYFDSSTDMSLMLDIYTTEEFNNGDNAGKSIAFTKEDSGYVATTKLINDFYIVEVRDTTDDTIIKRESIRIVKDRITSFRVDSNGNIVINIEDNIEKEPILTLTASDSNAVYEDTIIFSTAVKNIEGPRYIWYLDNVLIEGASESTYSKLIDSSLSEGFHEISCIAISNDKAASACLKFTVLSTSPRPEEIKVKGDVEFIVTQDVLVDNDTEIILTGSNGYRTTFRTQSHVYERGHFDQETTISAKVSTQRAYAYSYYFEIEPSSSLTRVYIVLDRDIEDPGYLRVSHDYHYTFKENQSLGVRFYKDDNRNDDLGILTGVDKRTRTLKLEPGRYETRGSIWHRTGPAYGQR